MIQLIETDDKTYRIKRAGKMDVVGKKRGWSANGRLPLK